MDGQEIDIRAVRTRSEWLKAAVDRAYAEKYKTPGSIKMGGGKPVACRLRSTPLPFTGRVSSPVQRLGWVLPFFLRDISRARLS